MRDDHKSARHNAKCLKEGWGKQIYSLFTASRAMRNESDEPIQLYRPANLCKEVEDLLLREDDFTDEQIRDFISGKPLPPKVKETSNVDRWREKFHKRRAEIQELSKQLKTGKARIDEYGRLVPVTQPPQPPRANLPPGPQVAAVQQPPPLNFLGDEDEEEQWIERERREAAETIARAVRQYRQEGIPEDEFEVVLIEPGGINPTNLTFRRICIAIFAVVLAFGCIILQTLTLLGSKEMFNPHFDKLLHHLLHVRFLKTHAQHCPGLHREASGNDNWKDRFRQNAFECNDGVLHIPAKHVLLGNYMQASTKEEKELLDSYKYGINVSWPLPCRAVNDVNTSSCYPGTTTAATEACPASTPFPLCFRGVHDNIISSSEVENAIRLGNHLIMKGGDHFDVHYEIAHLGRRVPSIVEKLSRLLRENYNVENLNPVAFRINTVGPMDGLGVNLYRSPANTLNQTSYLDWIEKCKRHNERAYYSLPWPFRVQPKRDTCNLMADMEVDSRFAIHTSVFLVDGAGVDYRGGVSLYMDNHHSNSNPKHRIQRGVTIDGSRGRVVVSTGGVENLRCRLPTRAGLRSVLQIWWDC